MNVLPLDSLYSMQVSECSLAKWRMINLDSLQIDLTGDHYAKTYD